MSIINSFSRASFSIALIGAVAVSACGDDGDDTESDAGAQTSAATEGANTPRAGSSANTRAGRGGSAGSNATEPGRSTGGTSAGTPRAAAGSGSGGTAGRRGLPRGTAGTGAAGTGVAGTAGTTGAAGIGDDDAGTRPVIDLSDGQIAEVASTANAGEITLGMVGVTRAQTVGARDYAQTMISAHTAAQTRQTTLVNTLGITAAPSSLSQQLSENAAAVLKQLQNASVAEFDILYVRSQVDMHLQVLQGIDEQLLPNVSADALRAELVLTRTEVQAHLESARALLGTLEGVDLSDAGVP